MARVKVAAAQIACSPGNITANTDLHLAMLEAARAQAVELLVFPELSLTGYESRPDLPRLACRADGPELARIAAAAGGIVTVVGFIEQGGGARPFNACAILDRGRVVHVHRKLNLPAYGALVEGEHYAGGSALDLASTPLGRTACLICADSWNPALPWLAALDGAEAVVMPIASAVGAVSPEFDSRENWTLNLRHTAMTYGLPVVMANQCGREGGLAFWGGSTILDACGRVVAEARGEPELVVAEIDPANGIRARTRLPTMRDAAPALIRDLLNDRFLSSSRRIP